MLGWLSAVREEQRKIVCDGLIDPLIPVARPTDDVAPPLVGDLMIGDDIRKRLLPCGGECGAVLRFGGQERKRGEIEQAGPGLAESAGNLRDTQSAEGERAAECFVKVDGRIDVPGKCFERVGRAWRQGLHRDAIPGAWRTVWNIDRGKRPRVDSVQTIAEGL